MTLKEACGRHKIPYHRAWYLYATGKLKADFIGRTWMLTEEQAQEMKATLEKRSRKVKKPKEF